MISDFKFRVRRSDIKNAKMMIIEDFQQIGDWRDMAQCLENCGQFTGLHDKNGKEIYEQMEINNTFVIKWLKFRYVLFYISNLTKFEEIFNYENELEITGEHTEL